MKERPVTYPLLYAVFFSLHVLSFLLFVTSMVHLAYTCVFAIGYTVSVVSEYFLLILNRENFFWFLLVFCGLMTERPTNWMVQIAKSPQTFILKKEKKLMTFYAPFRWFLVYFIIFPILFIFVSTTLEEGEYSGIAVALNATIIDYAWILVVSVLISLVCIAVASWYDKKLMLHGMGKI